MGRDPDVTIRRVGAAEVRPLRHAVLRPGQPLEACVYPRDDDEVVVHLGAFDAGGALVGIATLLPGEARQAGQPPYVEAGARFRGMAVEPSRRKAGIGSALLEELRRLAREAGVGELWANARLSAVGFYVAQGFRVVSTEFELPGLGPHLVVADAP